MSFLGRLFGGSRPAPPPATAVVLPEDLAAALTADGSPLGDAAVAALRAHLAERDRAARAPEATGEKMPFWLARDQPGEHGEGIEDRLRDRLEQRRSNDEGGAPGAA